MCVCQGALWGRWVARARLQVVGEVVLDDERAGLAERLVVAGNVHFFVVDRDVALAALDAHRTLQQFLHIRAARLGHVVIEQAFGRVGARAARARHRVERLRLQGVANGEEGEHNDKGLAEHARK